jgi:hypothetical protein
MHVDAPEQDTQNNWPVGATGFGLGTFAQPEPDTPAPAGPASAVAARAADAMTAKMTRSRTGRMGPLLREPHDSSRQARLVSSRLQIASTPACSAALIQHRSTRQRLSHVPCPLLWRAICPVAGEDLNLRPLGYEQAERCRNSSRPVAHPHAGLGRRRHAVSACLHTFGSFRGVLVTITVTRARTVVRSGPTMSVYSGLIF